MRAKLTQSLAKQFALSKTNLVFINQKASSRKINTAKSICLHKKYI